MTQGEAKYSIDAKGRPRHWFSASGSARIVGVPAEGYVMMRFKGAVPFVFPVKELCRGEAFRGLGPFVPMPDALK